MRHWIWCDIDQRIPILTSASPQSILILSGRYHIISNASLVNNCIMLPDQSCTWQIFTNKGCLAKVIPDKSPQKNVAWPNLYLTNLHKRMLPDQSCTWQISTNECCLTKVVPDKSSQMNVAWPKLYLTNLHKWMLPDQSYTWQISSNKSCLAKVVPDKSLQKNVAWPKFGQATFLCGDLPSLVRKNSFVEICQVWSGQAISSLEP